MAFVWIMSYVAAFLLGIVSFAGIIFYVISRKPVQSQSTTEIDMP